MKFSKKLISLTLAAFMVQSVFAAGISSASSYNTEVFQSSAVSHKEAVGDTELLSFGDFMYKVENNAITIVSYGGSGADTLNIPSNINGLPQRCILPVPFRKHYNSDYRYKNRRLRFPAL